MNKTRLLEVLDSHKFTVEKSEMFLKNHEEFVYCVNEDKHLSLIVKEYQEYSQSKIINDVMKVRTILKEHEINIWNSYYLILCTSVELLEEIGTKIYSIERNSKGLRKYVIMSEADLYRIPFIKDSYSEEISLNFETNFEEILSTSDQEVSMLLKWILESDGDFLEIKKPLIKDRINKFL
ncbi:ABC-three component system middle component 1 [Bacillus mycoides]